MRQRRETGLVQRRDQQPRGEAGGFGRVVVLAALTVFSGAPAFLEDGDQPGRLLEEGLVGIGPQRREGVQPLLRSPVLVEVPFFFLGGRPNPALDVRVARDDEPPRLVVRTGSMPSTARRSRSSKAAK